MSLEQVRAKVDELLQQSPFASLNSDMKLLLQSQLTSLLTKANLVTREEFEVQSIALARAQTKLAELEEKINQLSS